MRTTILAILLAASASIALPAMAQDTRAPQQKGVDQHMQNEADKGMKTRNSGESGCRSGQAGRFFPSPGPAEDYDRFKPHRN